MVSSSRTVWSSLERQLHRANRLGDLDLLGRHLACRVICLILKRQMRSLRGAAWATVSVSGVYESKSQ